MIAQTEASVVRLGLVLVALAGLAACSGHQAVQTEASEPVRIEAGANAVGEDAARVAMQQVGVAYRYGGASPNGFDCSGLVHFSYLRAGKSVPRTTTQQWNSFAPIDNKRIREGDVLFFRIDGKMAHVGMYVGDGRFVHAPSSGKTVSVESLSNDYYRNAFIRAGRPR